ncbi:DUF2681 domain-containing protein [Pasteurellaceae bacterium 22721_9_1]
MNILIIVLIVIGILFFLFCSWKLKQANQRIDDLFKENQQLQTEKEIAVTQVKNHQVRKQYEQNSRHSDRTSVLDSLHTEGDLRD